MEENAGGLERPTFAYLRERFETFRDFASVVSFLQSSAIEGGSNKRWSSKFVFPFGTTALYEDVSVTASGVSTDRRFFARTGEVLYLMLCRSTKVAALRDLLLKRFLLAEAPYDGLVGALQGETQLARQERAGAYLPVARYATFDRLAGDWIALLQLQTPIYDLMPHTRGSVGVVDRLSRKMESAMARVTSTFSDGQARPVLQAVFGKPTLQLSIGVLLTGALVPHPRVSFALRASDTGAS